MSTIKHYEQGESENPVPVDSTKIYTLEEYEHMLEEGTWTGGNVEGMGYVMGEIVIYGSEIIPDDIDSDDIWANPFDSAEHIIDDNPNNPHTPDDCSNNGNSGDSNHNSPDNPNNTKSGASVARKAKVYLGYNETKNASQIVKWLNDVGIGTSSPKVSWCAAFVYAMFKEAGLAGCRSASVSAWRNEWGVFVSEPQVGDVAFFDKMGWSHIGIVTAVNGNIVSVISGNYSDCVMEKAIDMQMLIYKRGK